MIFGPTPLAEAEDAILAHSLKVGGKAFKKGRRLSAEDLATFSAAGVDSVIAARLESGDVHEDTAAGHLAEAITGPGLTATTAFTGRSNLVAAAPGLLVCDAARLNALNSVDEAVTLATLPSYRVVEARQMVATIKIIPFAVPGPALEQCLTVARTGAPLLRIAPLRARRCGLIQTTLPGLKESLLDKTHRVAAARLSTLGCPDAVERRCPHDPDAIAEALKALLSEGCELILISGASAIVDRRDVVPAGIEAAGGSIDHFGMPVDPGNLLLLAEVRDMPVIGLPGCARSPKLNGFDWVLQRLMADLPVGRVEIAQMGAGGLLKEISSRPLPRAEAAPESSKVLAPRIGGLLLAAGQSRRMGPRNKLLAEIKGQPLVRGVAETLQASQAEPLYAVTGHEQAQVESVLHNLALNFLHNPDYATGLASSLRCGLAGLPEDLDGVVICLGDMPQVTPAVIDKLIAAFDPLEGRSICIPTWQGKRGNPVLLGRRYFAEAQGLAGDVGAKALIANYPDEVCEVPAEDAGVLVDADTPEALAALKGNT